MDCEHGAPGVAGCTMSCCHNTQRALLTPAAFVLHPAISLHGLSAVGRIAERRAVQDIPQSSRPPSPPPRFAIAAA